MQKYAKAFYKSKTIILNTIVALLAILGIATGWITENVTNPAVLAYVMIGVNMLNVARRFVTKLPVAAQDEYAGNSTSMPSSDEDV